jgi:hypothetical protein
MMFTDVNLAGTIDGIALAHFARQRFPDLHVVVTSGETQTKALPDGARFIPSRGVRSTCFARLNARCTDRVQRGSFCHARRA